MCEQIKANPTLCSHWLIPSSSFSWLQTEVSAPWGHDGLVYRTRTGAGCACGPLACAAPPCVSSHAPSWSKWIPCSGNGALIAKAAADVEMRTAGRTFCADTGGFWPPRCNQSEQRSSVFSSSRKYQCCIPADKSSGSVSSDESTDVYLDPSAPLRLMMSILSLFTLRFGSRILESLVNQLKRRQLWLQGLVWTVGSRQPPIVSPSNLVLVLFWLPNLNPQMWNYK